MAQALLQLGLLAALLQLSLAAPAPAQNVTGGAGRRGPHLKYVKPDSADHPLVSTLEPWNASFTGPHDEARDFYVFRNVMLSNSSLNFYHIGDRLANLTEQLPAKLRLSRYELQVELPVNLVTQENRTRFPEHCSRWVAEPALLFSGSPWDDNIGEWFTTNYMAWWQTAVMSGVLDPGRAERQLGMDRLELAEELHDPATSSPFTLITARPNFYAARWGYLMDYVTREQWALRGLDRVCFSKLVVSEDAVLRFLYQRSVEMKNASYVAYRAAWFQRFQQHLFALEKLNAVTHEVDWTLPAPQQLGHRPRVTLISRPPSKRRGVLNEPELVDYLAATWDVEVRNTTFIMPLREAITLMQETDVLIGMHGAGFTNAFWLRPGSVMLQLLPYGWEVHPGQLIRSAISSDWAACFNGSYFQWVNPYPHNAHFHKGDFDYQLANWKEMWGTPPSGYAPHPTAEMKLPDGPDSPNFWMYQDTWVDIESLAPVLDAAMQAAGAQKRKGTSH